MGTDIHSIAQVKRDGQWVTVAIGIAGDQRNYNTFAMLANVRNGRGFAGCWTSTGFPRGLPEDLAAVDDIEDDEDDNPDPSVCVDKAQLVAAWDRSGFETSINNPEARRVRWLKDSSSRVDLGDHSRSWCTLAELRAFIDVAKKSGLGDIEKALSLVAERTGAQPEDLRFVYGFDS